MPSQKKALKCVVASISNQIAEQATREFDHTLYPFVFTHESSNAKFCEKFPLHLHKFRHFQFNHMNDNLKSAILANLSLVVLIFLCILFVEGIKATSQGNTMSSNQQHQKTTEEQIADITKRHYQPDIHRETRDRLKDLIGDSANVQQQQNPNHPFKEVLEANPEKH